MHADIILRHYDMSSLKSDLKVNKKYEDTIRRCRDRLAVMIINEEIII